MIQNVPKVNKYGGAHDQKVNKYCGVLTYFALILTLFEKRIINVYTLRVSVLLC